MDQPSAQISGIFRSAKPILARKRARDDSSIRCRPQDSLPQITNGGKVDGPALVSITERVPLAELPVNTQSTFLNRTPTAIGYGHSLCDGIDDSFSARREATPIVSTKSLRLSDFETPRKGPDCLSASTMAISVVSAESLGPSDFETPRTEAEHSKSWDCFPMTGLLDDDFDESILEQIDNICQQKSAAKSMGQEPYGSFQVEGRNENDINGDVNLSSGPISAIESVRSGDLLKHLVVFDPKEHADSRNGTQNGNMPEEYSKYLQSLNDRQREAACTDISTPLIIVAGPGSGKTSTMVGRILVLLSEGIGPSNILAMTLTTAAASEMRQRIGTIAGKAIAKELTISTFHSFSLQLCRSHAEKLGRTSDFLVYGQSQQRKAIIEAIRLLDNGKNGQKDCSLLIGEKSNGLTGQQFKDKAKKWQKFVTQAKASGRTYAEYRELGNEMGAEILEKYNNILQSCNALDYHDLISCSVKLLSDFPEVFKECQDLWKAIVIDEFQDTSSMQYTFLRVLASHHKITIVGDDDQSIFSFNGADASGFVSFRSDFPNYKEIRLNKNYRSTRYIVEAASSLIRNNTKRCQLKNALTDNSSGSKITVMECHNEDAQCASVVDKILEFSSADCSYGNIAILYRRQISGKAFQMAFRERKIPFNTHGVAFYRKKVVKTIIAMLRTALPGCDDGPYLRVFKALLPFEKEQKKRVVEHVNKISTIRKCSFLSAACEIFNAKISGTFKRSQLVHGRKVLVTLEMISKLVHQESSISAVISSVANMIPEKYLLDQRAVVDVDGGTYLNEDCDVRSVLQYLLDDVSEFLSTKLVEVKRDEEVMLEKGCINVLRKFIDYLSQREKENFCARRNDNKNSVTLTTIHQAKGLEWDVVFIIKANESEIPLLHDYNGNVKETGALVEEERRLFYVAMTRARQKLFILYVTMDSNWQILQLSRFVKEIPHHLLEVQGEISKQELHVKREVLSKETVQSNDLLVNKQPPEADVMPIPSCLLNNDDSEVSMELAEVAWANNGSNFLRRFNVEDRSLISQLFHQWAKKKAFHDPKRLLGKVGFIIDERLRDKRNKNKDLLRSLKSCLSCDEAFQYAQYVLRWELIPADKRALLMREKQLRFAVWDNRKRYMLMKIGDAWRNRRNRFFHNMDKDGTIPLQQPIKNISDGVPPNDWVSFVQFRRSAKGQALSQRNTRCLRQQMIHHTARSKTFAITYSKLERKAQQENRQTDYRELFTITHRHRDETPTSQ